LGQDTIYLFSTKHQVISTFKFRCSNMVALTPVTNNKHCLMAPVQTEVQAQTSELAAAIESPFHTGSDEWFRHQENRAVTRRQM